MNLPTVSGLPVIGGGESAVKKNTIDTCRSIMLQEVQRLRALQAKEFKGDRDKTISTLNRLEGRMRKLT